LTGPRSLLQETVLRLADFRRVEMDPELIVVTNEEYRFTVGEQLAEIGITHPYLILEPVGRNTAPAVTLAALRVRGPEQDPILLVMPSDYLIGDIPAFQRAVAEGVAQAAAGFIVSFGVAADRPETGYGYIEVGDAIAGDGPARRLTAFVEKPDSETAARYVASGDYLWNSGIFMMKSSVWLRAVERHSPAIGEACRRGLDRPQPDENLMSVDGASFGSCPSESIDYAVMERLGQADATLTAVVIPLQAGWSDVGGWGAVWNASVKDESGNVVRGEAVLQDSRDTLVFADSRLVATLGVDKLVVAETADAVLVAARDKTADLKRLLARVQETDRSLPSCRGRVYRPWGSFDCIDAGTRFQVKHIIVEPGRSLSLQLHRHRAEHWVVIRGLAKVECGNQVFQLREDESAYVPVGTVHRLSNPGSDRLEIIEVQSGDYLGEDDIVRFDDTFGRLVESQPEAPGTA